MIIILTKDELEGMKDSAILRADIACVKQEEGYNVFKNRTNGVCEIFSASEFSDLVNEYVRLKVNK